MPDNTTLVSGCKDGSVCLWDTQASSRPIRYVTLPTQVAAWRFAPDSKSILTAHWDGRVAQWSGIDFQQSTTLLQIDPRPSYHISRDGRYVATGSTDGRVRVWDLQGKRLLREIKAGSGSVSPVVFFAQGTRLVVKDNQQALLREWDLTSAAEVQSWRCARECAFSPDERQCVMLGEDGSSWLRDMRAQKDAPLDLALRVVSAGEFSPDGKLFAGTSFYGYARLWDTAKFQPVATLSGFFMGVHSAAFSPDGTRLATGSCGFEAVKLWDVQSHQQLITLEGQGTALDLTAFSPDGNVLGSRNGFKNILHLWRAPSWEEIAAVEKGQVAP